MERKIEIKDLLRSAYVKAVNTKDEGKTRKEIHRNRSKEFVENLGEEFRSIYTDKNTHRVFTKRHIKNKTEFGMNELLYDVLVCEISNINSASGKHLLFTKQALWQIESEFRKDIREALFDFNKLVIGTADNKLFIGPLAEYQQEFMDSLSQVAEHCSGNVYLALLPHPEGWKSIGVPELSCWKYDNKKWIEI